ncbi:MAG TPA: CHRD domain-containing protein [Candidatus Limnocylindria bacterium]|nr:CHRD domain-containing protein [Candidatus Limnocylindria bacterium]
MPKPLIRLLAVLATVGLIASLGAGAAAAAAPQATEVYRLSLTGDQEATPTCAPPAVCGDPDAGGEMILIVNPNNDTVCFLTRWRDIDGTVVAAHIHTGVAGVPGGVVVPLFAGQFAGTDQLRACVAGNGWTDDINANPAGFYVNIHSTTYQAGAIRAQLG